MVFLIEYDRSAGRTIAIRSFDESNRTAAQEARLELELDLIRQDIDHEVVLLEARNEAALRKTHRRYFEDAGSIARSGG